MVTSDSVFERFFLICGDMLALAGFDGQFKLVNPAWKTHLGYSPEELKAVTLFDIVHSDDRDALSRAVEGLTRGRESAPFELRCRAKDGLCRRLLFSAGTSPHDHSLYLIARDVTSGGTHDGLQEKRMQNVGRLASGLAHDFNNIITAMLGYVGFLNRSLKLDGQQQSDFEEIRKAARRAAELTRRLFAYSRRQPVPPAPAQLNDLAADMEKLLRRLLRENIELRCDLDPDLPPVKIDLGQVEQTIMDLVVNTAEALPLGGTITLKTSKSADRGRWGGSGAALTVDGAGDSVTLHFPFAEPPHHAAQSQPEADPSRGAEMILIVEDEDSVREVMRRSLTQFGYEVVLASCAEDGLNVLKSESGKAVRLMITDLVMPGMGGVELVKRVRQNYPHIQVLFMSGYTDRTESIGELSQLKVTVLQKPFVPEGLAQSVKEALAA